MSKRRGLVLWLACCAPVSADVVASCGASEGWGYFVPSGLVPKEESGWEKDRISKGSFQLVRRLEEWDIVYTDTIGTTSARATGGQVFGFATKDGDIVVNVLYPHSFETYVFWLSLPEPVASYSQAKHGTAIRKHAVMVAKCARGRRQ
jgi:hypothetical protein